MYFNIILPYMSNSLNGVFPCAFLTENMYEFLKFPVRTLHLTHFILLGLIAQIIVHMKPTAQIVMIVFP
jgi:hypothetical protein